MKKRIHYIVMLLCLPFAFAACEKIEPELFDEGANGAYFDYEYAVDFDRTLNFSDHIVGNPDTVTMTLKVKLLGYLMEESRTLSVKTKEIEGYELADVTIDEVVFSGKEYEKEIEVKIRRPELEDSIYAVCIYLDGSGDIGTGISGKTEVNIYVTESYEQPAVWYGNVETLLGAWSKEKHIALAEFTGNNSFYSNFVDREGVHVYDSILALNVKCVNALLAAEPAGPVAMELPIVAEIHHPAYTIPYFWKEYEDLLGPFRAGKFCRFTEMLGGAGTKDVAALYAGDVARQKMAEESDGFHKDDFFFMLNQYNDYAMSGAPLSEYRNMFKVEIRREVDYFKQDKDTLMLKRPFWWDDPKLLGTAAVVKKYFGNFSYRKYQFMLITMSEEDGTADFLAASIFPFVYDSENRSFVWDKTPFGKKGLAGEERFKECYRIIKAANDLLRPSRRYDIPDVELE